jgi:NAD(P)-dependent dehydrogenase (short-subunit alcohol dehydrogenase family)
MRISRANAICPGPIKTSMTAEKFEDGEARDTFERYTLLPYFGEPRDVGRAAVFLASERSRYVNGESLIVDGGATHTG